MGNRAVQNRLQNTNSYWNGPAVGSVFLNNSDQDFKRIFRRDDKTESLEPSRAMKISQFAENIPCVF